MSAQVPFSIVFTPRGGAADTLVAGDGWLDKLPDFAGEQVVFDAPGMATVNEHFRPMGGATVSFELGIERDEATLLAAQIEMLDAGLPVHGTLAMVADGWAAEFAAVISDREPTLPGGTGTATLVRKLTVMAGVPTLTED